MKLTRKYFKLSNNIFELGLKPNEFVVLAYIARCSNNNAKAFPSYNKIAEKCNIGLSTAKRVVSDLVKKELLTKENRVSDNKSNNSNIYSLTEKVLVHNVLKEIEEEIQEVTQEMSEEDITDNEQETNEIIEKYYSGELKVSEFDEKKDAEDKVEVLSIHLKNAPNASLRNEIVSLTWDEIIKVDEQVNENKVEEYVTPNYLLNAIRDNRILPKLRLVK